MNCKDIALGSCDCAYNIQTPWISDDGKAHLICIDKCLLPEILKLWEMGIRTTGCCCGHGVKNRAFIGVREDFIPKMKALGYKVFSNHCRPCDEDSFVPKTKIAYGNADKGFNWLDKKIEPGYVESKEGESA